MDTLNTKCKGGGGHGRLRLVMVYHGIPVVSEWGGWGVELSGTGIPEAWEQASWELVLALTPLKDYHHTL